MNTEARLERCLSFIHCQLQSPRPGLAAYRGGAHRRAITISRQTGSGGYIVAEKLAEFLQRHTPDESCPWTVFDRNLVERVLSEHHLPGRLAQFMPEDRIGEITDTIDELFGLHPPSWTLVRQTAETILHLVELGNVILLGRGAHVITRKLGYMFHVRLVGSLENRVRRVQQMNRLSAAAARAFINREDLGRRRYLRKYFDADVDNPLLYHLVLNTDLITCDDAARIIGEAVMPANSKAELTEAYSS